MRGEGRSECWGGAFPNQLAHEERGLVIGVILTLLFGVLPLPDISGLGARLIRNIAFIGMGVAVLVCAGGLDKVKG